jgi:hydroxyacylglutathione hydrolase
MFDIGRPQKKPSIKIMDHLYYFGESPMLDCSIYLLENNSGELLLIDTGNGASLDATLESMQKLNFNPKKITHVLLTHEHLDHVLGLYPLLKLLPKAPIVHAHPITAAILQEGDEEKICPGAIGISAATFGVEIQPLQVQSLKEGELFQFGDFEFQILDTPGHSLGSLTYFDSKHKVIFPGDVVFPEGSFGRYDFPGGSLDILRSSIKKLADLDVEHLCAGHMYPVDDGKRNIQLSLQNAMFDFS